MDTASINSLAPGAIICEAGDIAINAGRESKTLRVTNRGDRPIQIGSHFHFFEVNRALSFDRPETLDFRLDIPAGTAVRFEPGDSQMVTLVALAGDRMVQGLNDLVNGQLDDPQIRAAALAKVKAKNYDHSSANDGEEINGN